VGIGTGMTVRATVPSTPAAPPATPAPRRRSFARWSPGGAVGITVLALVAGWIVAGGATLLASSDHASWIDGAALFAADLATLALVIVFARRGADKLGPATFGLQRTDVTSAFGWGFLAYIGYVAFAALWATLVGVGEDPGGATSIDGNDAIVIALLFAGVAITAPIVEEIVFRGYLFAALTRWKGPWPAAIVSGALFGLAHVFVHPPAVWLSLAVMGFLLALVFWISGSLLPCIALHSANNTLVMAISLGWTWQVPLALVAVPTATVLLLLPVSAARRRAQTAAPAETAA
jgi:membrane protease YdiL (CAAX protease family)